MNIFVHPYRGYSPSCEVCVKVEGAHDGDQSLLPLSGTPDRALHRKLAVVQEEVNGARQSVEKKRHVQNTASLGHTTPAINTNCLVRLRHSFDFHRDISSSNIAQIAV